ncbi:unnamed protein product [Ambrosiozyma monospora]|uniref:Unnamed protein product n=1 Tax=Ambrosiozyma monospora TaxID=43982 RepID=A0ACB5T883_AMBMO|nr:unnamed protein product [Ambrosiozyma monospora]
MELHDQQQMRRKSVLNTKFRKPDNEDQKRFENDLYMNQNMEVRDLVIPEVDEDEEEEDFIEPKEQAQQQSVPEIKTTVTQDVFDNPNDSNTEASMDLTQDNTTKKDSVTSSDKTHETSDKISPSKNTESSSTKTVESMTSPPVKIGIAEPSKSKQTSTSTSSSLGSNPVKLVFTSSTSLPPTILSSSSSPDTRSDQTSSPHKTQPTSTESTYESQEAPDVEDSLLILDNIETDSKTESNAKDVKKVTKPSSEHKVKRVTKPSGSNKVKKVTKSSDANKGKSFTKSSGASKSTNVLESSATNAKKLTKSSGTKKVKTNKPKNPKKKEHTMVYMSSIEPESDEGDDDDENPFVDETFNSSSHQSSRRQSLRYVIESQLTDNTSDPSSSNRRSSWLEPDPLAMNSRTNDRKRRRKSISYQLPPLNKKMRRESDRFVDAVPAPIENFDITQENNNISPVSSPTPKKPGRRRNVPNVAKSTKSSRSKTTDLKKKKKTTKRKNVLKPVNPSKLNSSNVIPHSDDQEDKVPSSSVFDFDFELEDQENIRTKRMPVKDMLKKKSGREISLEL